MINMSLANWRKMPGRVQHVVWCSQPTTSIGLNPKSISLPSTSLVVPRHGICKRRQTISGDVSHGRAGNSAPNSATCGRCYSQLAQSMERPCNRIRESNRYRRATIQTIDHARPIPIRPRHLWGSQSRFTDHIRAQDQCIKRCLE